LLGLTDDAPNARKSKLPKARQSISLKKMAKLNSGLAVDVRQNRLMKR
jgi:hypothetical protein